MKTGWRGKLFGRKENRPESTAQDAETLRLPPLLLAAERVAASLYAGTHGQRRAGPGEDFWQFRPYQQGEPATLIDWRQSARSPREDVLWVRERERDVSRALFVWRDPSASMDWRSNAALPTKRDRAGLCALALAGAALRGGERAGLLGARAFRGAFRGQKALYRLASMLDHADETPLPPVERLPPRSEAVLVSDFLWEEGALDSVLARCAERAATVHLLCVLDPGERALAGKGRVRFEGLEGGALTLPAVEDLGAEYERVMTAHLDHLQQTAKHRRAGWHLHDTAHDPLPTLLALHLALGRRMGAGS